MKQQYFGTAAAAAYALLMGFAYGSQIMSIAKTGDTSGLSLQFFLFALIAVLLRVMTIGSAIIEVWAKAKVRSVANISLAMAEGVVVIGLAVIAIQIIMIR